MGALCTSKTLQVSLQLCILVLISGKTHFKQTSELKQIPRLTLTKWKLCMDRKY